VLHQRAVAQFLLLSLLWSFVAHGKEEPCEAIFRDVGYGHFSFNEIPVTGASIYPLEVVQHNLGWQDLHGKLRGKKVLSIAEGYSPFLESLQQEGAHAEALDLWYNQADKIPPSKEGRLAQTFVQKHKNSLITGDARHMPIADETYDYIFSHKLVNNLDFTATLQVSEEVRRVLKPGGEARIYGYGINEREAITAALKKSEPSLQISWLCGADPYMLKFGKTQNFCLLTMKKADF
jgi:SAM-dependent methyltransferase